MQKTNFKTRLLALLTAVFMVVMCVPFAAFADDDEIMDIKYYANNGSKLLSSGQFHKSWGEYTLLDSLQNGDIPEGQKLVGWTSTADSSKVLKGTYSWDDLSKYAQGGALSLDAVFESEAPATQNVGLVYYDFTNKVKALEKEVTVSADKTSFTAEEVKAYLPDGYELEDATKTSFDIAGGYVSIPVVKKAVPTTKTIKINYYSEAEKKQIAEDEITVAADATSVNTSNLTAPKGYKINETGDLQIRDGYVYVAVSKVEVPTTKTIKINYYSESENKQISEVDMTVGINDTYINTSKLTAPKGYKINETGDLQIRDGYVYVAVSKVEVPTTKTIKINYYSEAEEKQIAEVEMTVPADATYVNTSKLTAPAGYELVLAGDLPIRDGYVYAAVRKVPTTTIKISYVDEATDKEVGTENLVVNQGTTVVNFNVLKSVPAGYELCEVGDFYVGNGSAKVMVRKTKSNNGSSSSSASSSSNKTTTASSKAEQKVVKAAAAPANTTKVLPKTGASNVAPLLGGSLAVVALLMGYGVYSLVLRKKD